MRLANKIGLVTGAGSGIGRAMQPNVPYFWVEAVVETPYGAHPTSCYPFYSYDRAHLAEYYQTAQAGPETFARDYLDPYVFAPATHDDYLQRVGGIAKQQALQSWKDSDAAWMALFTTPEGAIA